MANVADLDIERQLLPLFDFTGNDRSRQVLSDLLLQLPGSVEEVYKRQRLIQCFIDNGYVHTNFSYHQQDFGEIFRTFSKLNEQVYYYDSSRVIAAVQLLWRRRYRHEMKSRLIQLLFFMEQLEDYFSSVEASVFPEVFAERVAALKKFLALFNAKEIANRIRKDQFRIGDQLFLLDLLNRKIVEKEAAMHWETFFTYEAWWSIAKGMVKHHFVFPEFSEKEVGLRGFYHPALKNPVKNDLRTEGNVMLLTGPNMSGKSTLLKALGICVYFAHAGLGVPADFCRLPYFDCITVIINLSDDLKHGYSHFMMEVQHLKNVVRDAREGKRCFAVFDELFRGTNVDDALDISQQTISGLNSFDGCFFVVSTHLYQLQPLLKDVNAWFIDCRLEEQEPHFLYKLREGWSDLKIGRIIFEREGLPGLLRIKNRE
ncbi:hypothetical protein [Chitinophaga sp. 212800010-3]|uniref:MutS-related protein n=1 Tax=unclassified Chitinophaga TaxID=2619133 RepID=UPI002DE75D4E|nr:hypothetical protein [Chitinophaga sp. 212800010-3]